MTSSPCAKFEQSAPEATAGILLVDDNPNNLLAIEAALEGLGINVVRAQSGTEALRHLLATDFALVLLDVQMPTLDGFQTARLIRQRDRNRDTPIIFVTAHDSSDEDVLQAYAMGAVDFLFKPIVPEILRAKASVLISLQRRTAEVAKQAGLLREQQRRLYEQELEERMRKWEQEMLRRQVEEKSRVAKEMQERAEELKRTIFEREQAEEKLTAINQCLAESDRRKDEFLAVLAHELRNPLAPIVTSLDLFEILLKDAKLDARVELDAARSAMRRQVQHLVRLVDDLLDLSRISSGKIELCTEDLELSPIIEQAALTSRPLLEERQHTLSLELAEEAIAVTADAVRLTQIIANLLNNAARYTPPGGNIVIQTLREDESVFIRIRDNGQGIPEDMLASIFDTFVQIRPNGEGLGLGLTLVKRLVELHGGSVGAKSFGAGKGSEFTVKLKAGVFAKTSVSRSVSRLEANGSAALDVVVVEDNEDIRELVCMLLGSMGHRVQTACNGADGVKLLLAAPPDVALVDIGLEGVDGYGVAERVRAELGERAPYLIAMTGYGQQKDKQRAMQAGFSAHLIKPASAEAIAQAFAAVSSGARKAPSAEAFRSKRTVS